MSFAAWLLCLTMGAAQGQGMTEADHQSLAQGGLKVVNGVLMDINTPVQRRAVRAGHRRAAPLWTPTNRRCFWYLADLGGWQGYAPDYEEPEETDWAGAPYGTSLIPAGVNPGWVWTPSPIPMTILPGFEYSPNTNGPSIFNPGGDQSITNPPVVVVEGPPITTVDEPDSGYLLGGFILVFGAVMMLDQHMRKTS